MMRRNRRLILLSAGIALAAALTVSAAAAVEPKPAEAVGRYDLSYPFPSPDGAKIVFQGNLDGRWQLYEMIAADGRIRRLHVSEQDDTHPAFSPDGRQLAFISNRDGNDEVYVLDLESGTARSVSPHPGKDGHPKWSPDGGWLVFNRTFDPADKGGDSGSAIMRVRPDGSGLEILSDTPHIETFASFSPDGKSIAFVEWFPDAAGTPSRNGEIVTVNLASKARRNLTQSNVFDGHPYWGADGWIYFSSVTEGGPAREMATYRIRPDGSGRERLTALDGVGEVRAIPARDGKTLYFNRSESGRTGIYRQPLTP